MSCELYSREITNSRGENILFTTRQLSASKQLDLQVELIVKLGNRVFPLIDGRYNFTDLVGLMAMADNKVVVELFKRVISNASKEGVPLQSVMFDMEFDGELMLVCKVFAFVLEANFKSFFEQGKEMNEQFRLEEEAILKAAEQKLRTPAQTSQETSPT